MKRTVICRVISLFLILAISLTLIGCADNSDDDCFICGGSGYYQKKDCPGC